MEVSKINDGIYYLVFFGSSGGLILASSVIFFYIRYQRRFIVQQAALQKAELEHKQHLLSATIQSQENERLRISKDLHDHIGSSVSNLRFMVARVRQLAPAHSDIHVITEEYKNNIDQIIEDVRNLSHSLSPAGLAVLGFHDTLEEFCEKTAFASGLDIQVVDYCEYMMKQLPFDTALALYRVVQELVANTIKHAAAKSIRITITKEGDYILLNYRDNGKGCAAPTTNTHGIGISNIESRLGMIQAAHEIISGEGNGYMFNIRLPFTFTESVVYEQ